MLGQYILVLSVLLSTIVGLFVVTRDIRSTEHKVYAVLTLSFVMLSIANYLSLEPTPEQLLYVRSVMASSSAAVYLLYLIVVSVKGQPLFTTKVGKGLLFATVAIVMLDYTPVIFSGNIPGSPAQPIPGPGVFLYFIHFLVMVSFAARKLYSGIRDTNAVPKKAQQYRFILVGLIPILVLAPATGFILPLLFHQSQLIVLTPMYSFFFVACVGYAMIRHGLFDIRLAAVRGATYILALAFLAVIYYLMAYIFSLMLPSDGANGISVTPANIMFALLLAFLFQPVRYLFDRITNRIFYRDAYKSEEFFASLSELLGSTTDLRGLLERAAKEISSTLKSEQSFFYLYYSNAITHHMSAGTSGHARLPFHDAKMLDAFVATRKRSIFVTELLEGENEQVRRMLVSHKIAIFMPLRHGNNLIGYLCLGDRLIGGYTRRDLRVLSTVADELVIAIQNAMSVHEVREINASLQQRIEVATKELRESNAQLHRLDAAKDEFVSMASHQLRTPLTSVKGYISMMLDGDVGKISDAQRTALEEAFNSSERMVRLISDFLSVSRLQTGKFIIEKKPTDLVKVVEQEIDGVRIIASTHGQKLAYVKPKKLPLVDIDEPKIRQVIMNFIDNAIYYSRPDTTIHVALGQVEDEIVLTVEDMGIGVPKEQQSRLFSKFYRATNARQQRPDGTGVGLYLAKKVITEHGGRVVFSSVENQGSTFGFRLPLKQNTDEPADKQSDAKDNGSSN